MYGDWLNGDPHARYDKLYTLNLQTAGRGFVEIVIDLNERQRTTCYQIFIFRATCPYGNKLVKLVCLLDFGKDGIIS